MQKVEDPRCRQGAPPRPSSFPSSSLSRSNPLTSSWRLTSSGRPSPRRWTGRRKFSPNVSPTFRSSSRVPVNSSFKSGLIRLCPAVLNSFIYWVCSSESGSTFKSSPAQWILLQMLLWLLWCSFGKWCSPHRFPTLFITRKSVSSSSSELWRVQRWQERRAVVPHVKLLSQGPNSVDIYLPTYLMHTF